MTASERKHFEVLLEQILHEVKAVAEGHGTLDDKMERFHKEAKEDHHVAMDLIKFSHDELKKELQSVDQRSEKRDRILAAELKETREEMAAGFKVVENKVDGHEERIVALERKAA